MDLFQITLFVSLLIGILLIIISMFMFKSENKSSAIEYLERDNTLKAISSSINELDKTMEEFDSLSKTAFEEMDAKYQEVLFLYNLLEEKRQEIASMYYSENKKPAKPTVLHEKINPTRYQNPKTKDILALKEQGLTVSDIAKRLDMGKGEVRLIIELSNGNLS